MVVAVLPFTASLGLVVVTRRVDVESGGHVEAYFDVGAMLDQNTELVPTAHNLLPAYRSFAELEAACNCGDGCGETAGGIAKRMPARRPPRD